MKLHPAYIAGVMDSDGSFSIIRRTRQSTKHGYFFKCLIQLTWKDTSNCLEVLNYLKQTYGGTVNKINRHSGFPSSTPSEHYKWDLEEKKVTAFIQEILPFLQVKKFQAQCLLDLRKLRRWRETTKSRFKPDVVWEKEKALHKKMYETNSKNKNVTRSTYANSV